MKKTIQVILLMVCGLIFSTQAHTEKAPRVILIGIDGMSAAGFQHAFTPNLDQIVKDGLITLNARIAMPSVSAPNWATHLMGTGPEQHGVTFNGWTPATTVLSPLCADNLGYFPSVFTVLRQQRPDLKTCFFYDWKELADMFNPADIGYSKYQQPERFQENIKEAADYIVTQKPDFAFLYIGHPDEVGHQYKWESPEYLKAIEDVDSALGYLCDKLREKGLYDDTFILVVSDHGGVEYSHGGLSASEMNVPWMIKGPGIIKGRMYALPLNTLQTAPTIVSLFGLSLPSCWIGKPAELICSKDGGAPLHKGIYVPAPELPFLKNMSDSPVRFEIKSPYKDLEVRYEIGDVLPTAASPVYTGPIILEKSCTVQAAAFKDKVMSKVEKAEFIKVCPIESYGLEPEPSPRYAGNGPSSLFDKKEASADFKDKAWLGFEGTNVTISMLLKASGSNKVVIGCLHQPSSWIFAPKSIRVEGSTDGHKYQSLGKWTANPESAELKHGRLRVEVPLKRLECNSLNIYIEAIGTCPEGHPGYGRAAWLFMDEVWAE